MDKKKSSPYYKFLQRISHDSEEQQKAIVHGNESATTQRVSESATSLHKK